MRHINFKILVLFLVWVMLAVLTGFFDLEISRSLVNKNSSWAKFLQDYGMIPGIIVLLFGIYAYYSYLVTNNSKMRLLKKVFFFIAANLLILYMLDVLITNFTLSEQSGANYYFLISGVSVILNSIIIVILEIKKIKLSDTSINFSKITIALGLWGYIICIQLVKTLWGRVRFRELDDLFSNFTPWFLPQGLTGYDSFPSGHAAMGWIILPLMILMNNKNRWLKYSVFCLICCWAIAVALSRVIIGAHYASDVLFGSFFIIATFYFLTNTTNRKNSS
ncbi:MAG TPA: phosphatase PAP2 family protein [Ignavibacteriaceae bacterium]|nr:phosphatase PAP2 family protein [Ignavibacteriaceae bacterium]